MVVGHGREAVAEHLDALAGELGREVTVAVQEEQNGTGHAVALRPGRAAGRPGRHRARHLRRRAAARHRRPCARCSPSTAAAGNAVTVLTAVVADPTGYGRIVRDADGSVAAIVEQKDATAEQRAITEINSGRVRVRRGGAASTACRRLSTDNAQGELYLTDVLGIARGDGRRVGALVARDPWLVEGVNDRVQLAALGAELNRRHRRAAGCAPA